MPIDAARRERRPLVSNASILILSGFLIGMTVGKMVAEDLSPYILACGLSGCLAYLGLEVASERRTEETKAAGEAEVSRRLDKHLITPLTPPLSLTFDGDPVAEFFREKGLDQRRGQSGTPSALASRS